MLLLKRMNVPLARDVIFLAEAGEEGTTRVGIDFLVERHWNQIEAEYALAEGGSAVAENGKVRYITIVTTEKVPRGIRLVAHGTAGHGSRPTEDNAVVRLAAAVAKAGNWQPPMRLNDTTRTYFERLATISPPGQAERYRNIVNPARRAEIEKHFARHELGHNAILRTSISPTMITAGFRSNVIPSEAEAYLDVRALPDEDMDQFVAELRRVIADPKVDVISAREARRPPGSPSRVDTEMFRALEKTQRRMYPGAITLPAMLTGATDMAQLRAQGVQAYGFGPVVEGEGSLEGGAHADDERLAENSMIQLVEFLWRAVIEVAARN
jgi:acetylornithine deacetylase/succinyl-diaminopimelate desuccinylase-like protein